MPREVIHLHHAAPAKPREGLLCNGCGVCCGLETCPVGRLRFLQKAGPCPALEWSDQAARYHCGFLLDPERYLPGLPRRAAGLASAALSRWIAAGQGCDCSAEVNPGASTQILRRRPELVEASDESASTNSR